MYNVYLLIITYLAEVRASLGRVRRRYAYTWRSLAASDFPFGILFLHLLFSAAVDCSRSRPLSLFRGHCLTGIIYFRFCRPCTKIGLFLFIYFFLARPIHADVFDYPRQKKKNNQIFPSSPFAGYTPLGDNYSLRGLYTERGDETNCSAAKHCIYCQQ